MKKTVSGGFFSFLAIGLLLLPGCGVKNDLPDNKEVVEEKMKVAATVYPLYDLLKIVGGDEINPVLILPPGASPHTFEPTPSRIKEIQDADILFAIGAGVDSWGEKMVSNVQETTVVNLDQYVSLKPFEKETIELADESEEESEHEHATGLDPHYWLDPENFEIMAKQIAQSLGDIDPKNLYYYEDRAWKFADELALKDKEWKEKINELPKKDIVVFHNAWGYFADHFGLTIAASFEPFPGQSPSPQYLVKLQDEIKDRQIKALFAEPQLSREAITALADDLEIKVDVLDPLGGVEGRETYIDLIDFNINNIVRNLGKN